MKGGGLVLKDLSRSPGITRLASTHSVRPARHLWSKVALLDKVQIRERLNSGEGLYKLKSPSIVKAVMSVTKRLVNFQTQNLSLARVCKVILGKLEKTGEARNVWKRMLLISCRQILLNSELGRKCLEKQCDVIAGIGMTSLPHTFPT